MNDMSPSQIRRRLGEIGDELRALPDDDFSEKNQLNLEADSLRRQLAAGLDHDSDSILAGWAERSSRKGAHTPADDVELAKARIVSPMDAGALSNDHLSNHAMRHPSIGAQRGEQFVRRYSAI